MFRMYDPSDFEDDSCYPKYESADEKRQREDLVEAAEWLEGVIDQLYGRDPYSEERLIECLQEISQTLGVKLPKRSLSVMNRRSLMIPTDLRSDDF